MSPTTRPKATRTTIRTPQKGHCDRHDKNHNESRSPTNNGRVFYDVWILVGTMFFLLLLPAGALLVPSMTPQRPLTPRTTTTTTTTPTTPTTIVSSLQFQPLQKKVIKRYVAVVAAAASIGNAEEEEENDTDTSETLIGMEKETIIDNDDDNDIEEKHHIYNYKSHYDDHDTTTTTTTTTRTKKMKTNTPYNFWEENLSIRNFNMDLYNLAMENPMLATDALEIMEDMYHQQHSNHNNNNNDLNNKQISVVKPNVVSYSIVIDGWIDYATPHSSSSSSPSSLSTFLAIRNTDQELQILKTLLEKMEQAYRYEKEQYHRQQKQQAAGVPAGGGGDETAASPFHSPSLQRSFNLLNLAYRVLCTKFANSHPPKQQSPRNYYQLQETMNYAQSIIYKLYEHNGISINGRTTSNRINIPPETIKLWTIVMEGYCKLADKLKPMAMMEAEKILTNMESFCFSSTTNTNTTTTSTTTTTTTTTVTHNHHPAKPNVLTYTTFIGGLARSKEKNLSYKAEEIINHRMKKYGIEPDIVTYTSLLNCYSKVVTYKERLRIIDRVLEILDLLETSYIQKNQYHMKPNLITYATAIHAIGNSIVPVPQKQQQPNKNEMAAMQDPAVIAESILRRVYHLYENNIIVGNIKPNVATFNALINALGRCSSSSSSSYSYSPNKEGRNTPTKSSSSSSSSSSTTTTNPPHYGIQNARKAEGILDEMIHRYTIQQEKDVLPNIRTWGGVLLAWAECNGDHQEAGKNAQRVIEKLITMYEQKETIVKPNFVCYTTLMRAWALSGTTSTSSSFHNQKGEDPISNKEIIQKIDSILEYMEQEYEKTLKIEIRPNTISYITAINAYVKLLPSSSPQQTTSEEDEEELYSAEYKTQTLIDRMMYLYSKNIGCIRPNRMIFNSLINVWSKSHHPEAPQKVEQIFQWMEKSSHVKPDEISLCGVLNAWANHATQGGARRAQQILDHMESLRLEERGFQYTVICHNIVIKAWGRSKELDAVTNAENILLKLENNNDNLLRPDVTTYSSVINCCAYYDGDTVEGKKEAFDVAMRTFHKLSSAKNNSAGNHNKNHKIPDEGPNNITYGTLFKAISKLIPMNEEREQIIRYLFNQCCEQGQVDAFVLSQVRIACSSKLFRELVLSSCGLEFNKNNNSSGNRNHHYQQGSSTNNRKKNRRFSTLATAATTTTTTTTTSKTDIRNSIQNRNSHKKGNTAAGSFNSKSRINFGTSDGFGESSSSSSSSTHSNSFSSANNRRTFNSNNYNKISIDTVLKNMPTSWGSKVLHDY